MAASAGPEIERLISLLAKLPGMGPRSARRAALALLKKRDQLLVPLAASLQETADKVVSCSVCGTPDTRDPCSICSDPGRDAGLICVVEEVGALWALERGGSYRGRYHVLGGLLSALDGRGPEALRIALSGAPTGRLSVGDFGRVSADSEVFAGWVEKMKGRFKTRAAPVGAAKPPAAAPARQAQAAPARPAAKG